MSSDDSLEVIEVRTTSAAKARKPAQQRKSALGRAWDFVFPQSYQQLRDEPMDSGQFWL